jgi:hypothetical protein
MEGLKKGEITLKQIYQISADYYKKKKGTTTEKAVSYTITNTIVKAQGTVKFNEETNKWEGLNRAVRFEFAVKCKELMTSKDKKRMEEKITDYPVIFSLMDIDLGLDSPFKWRTGANKAPMFQTAGMTLQQRENVTTQNRQNKVYLPFFFELEGVLPAYALLEGENHTNAPPKKANPQLVPYFDKLAMFCFENAIINMFNNAKVLAKLLG